MRAWHVLERLSRCMNNTKIVNRCCLLAVCTRRGCDKIETPAYKSIELSQNPEGEGYVHSRSCITHFLTLSRYSSSPRLKPFSLINFIISQQHLFLQASLRKRRWSIAGTHTIEYPTVRCKMFHETNGEVFTAHVPTHRVNSEIACVFLR